MGVIPHHHRYRVVRPSGAVRIVETLWDGKTRSAGRQCNDRLLSPLDPEKESKDEISRTAPPLTSSSAVRSSSGCNESGSITPAQIVGAFSGRSSDDGMIHVIAIVTTKPSQRSSEVQLFRENVPN